MSNYRVTCIILGIFMAVQTYGTTSIEQLLESGQLALSLTSKGGHQGACIRLQAKNIGDAFFVTKLEPGRLLVAGELHQQDILLTEEVILALSPQQGVERSITGFCYQSSDGSPQEGTPFYVGPMTDVYTRHAAHYLSQHKDLPPSTQQAAVWMLSDCHSISSIERTTNASNALVDYLADLLHISKPWYTTEHLKTVDAVYSPRILRVYGDIPFEVADYTNLSVEVLNPTGRPVKVLLKDVRYGPGNYSLPLDMHVDHWPSGTYEVKLMANDRMLKAETFEL